MILVCWYVSRLNADLCIIYNFFHFVFISDIYSKKRKDKLEKYRQMSDEEFDVFQVIPAPLLKFIDGFLKTGLAVTTALFVAAGIGITVEAWSKATGSDLPEGWDEFIVSTVEPNFTTGLLVLLGFSISLGVFATAQLGSGSSVYSEDP